MPAAGAILTIPANRTIILDTQTAPLAGLTILGSLVVGDADVASLQAMCWWTAADSKSARQPRRSNERQPARCPATSVAASTPALMYFGNTVLAVHGGTLSLHGRTITTAWTKLAADVAAGGVGGVIAITTKPVPSAQ